MFEFDFYRCLMANERQSNTHSRRTNYSYIEEQNEARTALLNSKVNQLKHLAVEIGEETRSQNKYLKVNKYYHRDMTETKCDRFIDSYIIPESVGRKKNRSSSLKIIFLKKPISGQVQANSIKFSGCVVERLW
jgi:hypothetical protein